MGDFSWLWHNLVSTLVWTLLSAGVITLFAYLKKIASEWFWPAFYGLAAAAIFVIGGNAFMRLVNLPKRPTVQVTPENVEQNIRAWLDDFGLSTKKQPDDPSLYFNLQATMPNGDPISVGRFKARDRYIAIQGTVTVSPVHQDVLKKFTPSEMEELEANLGRELALAKVTYSMTTPVNTVVLYSQVPLTSALTEDEFMQHMDEMDDGIVIVRNTIILAVRNL